MGVELPRLDLETFGDRLRRACTISLAEDVVRALHAHYEELRRWNPALSLVGPAAARDVVERHYAEALEALPLIPPRARTLVDVGSGAGFPGFVLAAALPGVDAVLVEPRQRRWAFLCAAARRARLPCRCLNARVVSPLPQGLPDRIDVVTFRALKLPTETLSALVTRLTASSRVFTWAGEDDPDLPPELEPGRVRALPGARHRRILALRPADAGRAP
ncbi:MAG: class I SAM-dependent methyltransferase [Acidobacteriota bacterium]|jgi:16S rRNA G527 N7-methylase RsmG